MHSGLSDRVPLNAITNAIVAIPVEIVKILSSYTTDYGLQVTRLHAERVTGLKYITQISIRIFIKPSELKIMQNEKAVLILRLQSFVRLIDWKGDRRSDFTNMPDYKVDTFN